ncbi:hypothetical protein [Oryza sativa Japonica Group]|uniref:Uncharacterized protein n=1 Tax=Oryza sativa subsp. japonica TaxID=39947 RepID=Q5JLV8_ORYSJ|nr:hypothetical protein [Oryza sativa Japonica Group]
MAYGGWTLCGRDLRNGFHEGCVQALVFAKEIDEEIGRRKDVPQYTWYCSRAARMHAAESARKTAGSRGSRPESEPVEGLELAAAVVLEKKEI